MKDYLKYWRVVKRYIKAKYQLKEETLEMLLFLKSEEYFTKGDFKKYDQVLPWNKNRWYMLKKNGWIELWRRRTGVDTDIHQLTYRAKRAVNEMYEKLEGDEIPESKWSNPLFKPNVRFADKVYRKAIRQMNADIRALRRGRPPLS